MKSTMIGLLFVSMFFATVAIASDQDMVIRARITINPDKPSYLEKIDREFMVSSKEQKLFLISHRGKLSAGETGARIRLDPERNIVELTEYTGSSSWTPEGKEKMTRTQYIWDFPIDILEKEEIDLHYGYHVIITKTK